MDDTAAQFSDIDNEEPLSKKQRESNAALSDSDDLADLFTADAGTALVVCHMCKTNDDEMNRRHAAENK